MNFTPKTALASFLAVTVLSILLLASPEPRTIIAQQPDYTAQCSNGITVPDPQNNTGLVQDCAALLDSKDTLAAEPPLSWSADVSIYDWEGIGIKSIQEGTYFRNRVGSLYLDNRNLTGIIPPKIGDVVKLTHLSLKRNQLSGSIPPEVGNLAQIYELSLNDNKLTGSIPSELGILSDLYYLRLHNNQLTGNIPSELGDLSLYYLRLGGNQLTGCIPAGLSDVSNNDFGSLGLPLCDTAHTTPTTTPRPTATPTPPITTPTPTATPIPPTVPDDVLNRLSAIESLLTTLQNLISALESRIAALESDASSSTPTPAVPTPTPAPVVSTPTPTPVVPTPTPVVSTSTPDDPCIKEFINSGSKDGSWDSDCESVTSRRMIIDSRRGDGPHYALYYTFTLTGPANVTVTLDSDDQDAFLYLLAGKGANVDEIEVLDARHYNDDHDSPQDTDPCANDGSLEEYDSCLTKSLAAGDYTLEATTYNSRVTGSFTLTVIGIR